MPRSIVELQEPRGINERCPQSRRHPERLAACRILNPLRGAIRLWLRLRQIDDTPSLTSPSYLVRNRTLGPPLENNPEIPPSSRAEGLRLLHGLATNLATSLQTPQEA